MGLAGMTAVFMTYPLDLARARMALLMEQGAQRMPSMVGTMRDVYLREGFMALYSGAKVQLQNDPKNIPNASLKHP